MLFRSKYHGTASFLGGLAPYAVTMRPGIAPKVALPENASALQRVLAHPATAHLFGGGLMGGMELGNEAVHGADRYTQADTPRDPLRATVSATSPHASAARMKSLM